MAASRALVTGAAGFIGRRLMRRLLADGWEVTAVVRAGHDSNRLGDLQGHVDFLERDLTEAADRTIGHHADTLFHLAAVGLHEAQPRPAEDVARINVTTTLSALRIALDARVSRVIHVGSGLEYGSGRLLPEDAPLRPTSMYGASKAAAWLLASAFCKQAGLELVGLRPFTVYGPGDSPHGLLGRALSAGLRGARMELTEGRQTRDFVFVDDAVDAIVLAAGNDRADGEVFNVCTAIDTEIREVVELIFGLSGRGGQPVFGALPYRDDEVWTCSGDSTKARQVLGWTPATSLEEGLARTVADATHRREEPAEASR